MIWGEAQKGSWEENEHSLSSGENCSGINETMFSQGFTFFSSSVEAGQKRNVAELADEIYSLFNKV